MRPDPLPAPGPDGDEPDSSPWTDDDAGPDQGLFVCLPSENLDMVRFARQRRHGE